MLLNECLHAERKTVETPAGPHHAKEVCVACGRFLGWLPKPETLAKAKHYFEQAIIWRRKPLTEWEKGFLFTLEKQGFRGISPKQQEILNRLEAKYG